MKRKEYPHSTYLHECFTYDALTGILTWKVRPTTHFASEHHCNLWNSRYSKTEAGTINKNRRRPTAKGYRMVTIDKKHYQTHLIIWVMVYGKLPDNPIDHNDENSLNNKITNLIERTVSDNLRKRSYSSNTSGIKGVHLDRNKRWVAQISVNGKVIYLGAFIDIDYAAKIYSTASYIIMGENLHSHQTFSNDEPEFQNIVNKLNKHRNRI